eukprot:365300_1
MTSLNTVSKIEIKSNNTNHNKDYDDFNAEYMELALKQAEIGKHSNEVPVGCVIVENNKIVIASGHNETNIRKNATKHCEIICIEYLSSKKDIYSLSNCYLYVTVESRKPRHTNRIERTSMIYFQSSPRS